MMFLTKHDIFELHARTEQLAAELIALESDSMQGHEAAVGAYLVQFFRKAGISVTIQPCSETRFNVIAEIPGRRNDRTILYSGHIDTVPLGETAGWTTSPLCASIRNGRMYGRGSCDMKGSVACSMSAAEYLAQRQIVPPATLRFVYDIDEENTNLGLKTYLRDPQAADLIIVGEPTSLRLAVGHRGVMAFTVTIRGKSAHVGQAELGKNAIYASTKAIEQIQRLNAVLQQQEQPYLGKPSIHVTQIASGEKVNVIPDQATIRIDRRLIYGETPQVCTEQLAAILENVQQQTGCKYSLSITTSCPPGLSSPELPVIQAIAKVLKQNTQCAEAVAFGASCEAGMLQEALHAPVVILGPGSIQQAHQLDEFIALEQLHKGTEIYLQLFTNLYWEGATQDHV